MKIRYKKGVKTSSDKIISLLFSSEENINLIDLAFLINQFAINELVVIKEKKLSKNYFWLKSLIEKAIKDAENNIDWKNVDEKEILKLKNNPFYLSDKSIKKFLEDRKDG